MTQFQKGQEVEVDFAPAGSGFTDWRTARIIAVGGKIHPRLKPSVCTVEFADGSRWVFNDEGMVRAIVGAPSQQ